MDNGLWISLSLNISGGMIWREVNGLPHWVPEWPLKSIEPRDTEWDQAIELIT